MASLFCKLLLILFLPGFGKVYSKMKKWLKRVLVGLFRMELIFTFGILLGFLPCLALSLGLMCIWWTPDFSVADLLLFGDRSWNVDLFGDLFDPPTVQNILGIHIPRTRVVDKWSWAPSSSGLLSMKSTRDISLSSSSRNSRLSPVD
jgi:hypothetical protein